MDTLNLNVFVVFTDMLHVSRTVFRAAASVTRAVGRGLKHKTICVRIRVYYMAEKVSTVIILMAWRFPKIRSLFANTHCHIIIICFYVGHSTLLVVCLYNNMYASQRSF